MQAPQEPPFEPHEPAYDPQETAGYEASYDVAPLPSASATWQDAMPHNPTDRTPPHDILAEQSVLGGMLQSKDAIAVVSGMLKGRDFYAPKHEIIFDAILSLYQMGDPTDVISVSDYLVKQGSLKRAGGLEYLHSLPGIVPTAANADYYAEIVDDKAVLRRLIEAGTRIVQMGFAQQGEPLDMVNRAQADIYSVAGDEKAEDYVPLIDAVQSAIEQIEYAHSNPEGSMGVPTGFRELDEKTNGFKGGQMIVIAARPGMGKSTLALDVARAAAIGAKIPTIFFSLEMGREEIATRLLSAESEIFMDRLQKGQLDAQQWPILANTQARVADAPLYIDDSPNLTLVEIRAKCRRLKQSATGLGAVVIDYLQLLTSGKRVESRQQEVSEFSRSLKLLAKELDVPVIALSQLNRAAEQRADKRPQMSDLRESGAIEQDADKIILLHRNLEAGQGDEGYGEAQFLLVKQRNGPTGEISVAFQGQFSRFRDMA